MKNKILHLLNWRLQDIEQHIPQIKEQGFTHIQISPLQPTKEENNSEWWLLYQPLSHTVGNRLGSLNDLDGLCDTAHKHGLKIIVDVVLRHLAGRNDGSLYPHELCDPRFMNNPSYWLSFEAGDVYNRYDCTHKAFGMPVVNYFNLEVQAMIQDFLTQVLERADGIRIDQLKHIALPREGSELLNMIKHNFSDKFIYGECIYMNKDLLSEYTQYCKVLSNTEVPYNKSEAVMMFESHDTYLTWDFTRNVSDEHRVCEYGRLLDQFDNVLFYARPYDDAAFGKHIKHINKLYN